jgi:hypothetical protein
MVLKMIGKMILRSVLNSAKGPLGEQKTAFKMWLTLDSNTYHGFTDLIIPSPSGTTQIDHVVVSPYGIFIIETKNKGGWIFGDEKSAKWTQTFRRKKYSFQNPLRQTYRHKKILAGWLPISESYIQTLVCFVGDCTFKTRMPENVMKTGPGGYIKSFTHEVLTQDEIDRVVRRLEQLSANSGLTTRDHIQSLQQRHSANLCPRCGSNLELKTAKKGKNAGKNFWGCEDFPKCRYTKNA